MAALPPDPAAGLVRAGSPTRFFFRGEDLPFFLSTYTVAAPAGALQVDARSTWPPPPVVREGGRDVMRAEARQAVGPRRRARSARASPSTCRWCMAGSGEGIDGVALATADAFLERIRPRRGDRGPGPVAPVPRRRRARTGEALVRAAHEAVMDKVDGNGPLTDQASHVLSRGRGNRTLLLVALLDALGIPARVALVRPFYVDPQPWRFPRLELYPVRGGPSRGGRKGLLARPVGPLGALRGPAARRPRRRGAGASAPGRVRCAGSGRRRSLESTTTRSCSGSRWSAGGDATIEGTETYAGFEGAGAKVALEQLDENGRRRALEQALSRSFRSLEVKEVRFEGERRVGEPLVIRYRARVSGLARPSGGRLMVDAIPYPARLGRPLRAAGRAGEPAAPRRRPDRPRCASR